MHVLDECVVRCVLCAVAKTASEARAPLSRKHSCSVERHTCTALQSINPSINPSIYPSLTRGESSGCCATKRARLTKPRCSPDARERALSGIAKYMCYRATYSAQDQSNRCTVQCAYSRSRQCSGGAACGGCCAMHRRVLEAICVVTGRVRARVWRTSENTHFRAGRWCSVPRATQLHCNDTLNFSQKSH
jgi:hypothetical protein